MTVKIEKAKIKDIPHLLKLWKEMMDYHLKLDPIYFRMVKNASKIMQKFIIKNIKDRNSNVLVAVKDDLVIGYTLGYLENGPPVYKIKTHGYISDLAVDKRYRKKGIGKKLTNELIKWFKSKKLTYAELRTHKTNINAIKAYKKMGFKEEQKLMRKKI